MFKAVNGDVVPMTPADIAQAEADAIVTVPVPPVVSDRQFFHACARLGLVSQSEALAAVKTGDIPPELQAIVDAIPDPDERFDAEMFLSGAVEFRRDHPLTEAVRLARSMTHTQVDDLFRLAGSL